MRRTQLLAATAFIVFAQGCADSQRNDVDVNLVMKPQVGRAEAATAEVTITNLSDHSVSLLSWYVPDADLQEPLFQLTRDGQPVRYIGPLYKRAQPDASDYVTLAPGASLVRTVDLARFYDLSTTGIYTVEVSVDDAGSSAVDSRIEGRVAVATIAKPARDSCSADQHLQIDAAIAAGRQYAAAARDYLGGAPSATARYTAWFGTFSASGWSTAQAHFTSIANAFATGTIVPDCSCHQKNVYAFVNPNQPYAITLCGAFWSAPPTGTDSKAGTLVHEMSHFNTTAATDDWAYGKANCTSLAQTDPTKALDNADSHEYFAENNPALN